MSVAHSLLNTGDLFLVSVTVSAQIERHETTFLEQPARSYAKLAGSTLSAASGFAFGRVIKLQISFAHAFIPAK